MINDKNYHDWKKIRQDVERKSKGWVQDELPYNTSHPHTNSKEEFYSQVSKANSLTKREFEELFWENLVKIGWRINEGHIVLVCKKCEHVLFSVNIKTINQAENTKVAYLKNPVKHLRSHEEWCLTEGEDHAVQG